MKNTRLVYSTDPKDNKTCPRCKNLQAACECPPVKPANFDRLTAVLRIEKSGRGGKTVTIIDKLPTSEDYLKELTKKLKKKCGSGGTHRLEKGQGLIEIQGDKREALRSLLADLGFTVKG